MDGAAPGTPCIYHDLVQGSDEWRAARCGLLTASEMHHIITPTMKPAKNEKMRAHAYELLAQRLTGYVEPSYISDDMLRGDDDEIDARRLSGGCAVSRRQSSRRTCGGKDGHGNGYD